ncbi:DMT family transporter [Nocardiopsis alborubida]|uniref:DMT family transporter n=1 Tax=Nocardiopsis alborubida TaxID=146802 RepID=A0A7X6MDV6_9ACTN|nr:DMT family transporter [Nocardiopsis alborubida]NKY97815.1 DMT family transporter [Nocardiopsis alborubida]
MKTQDSAIVPRGVAALGATLCAALGVLGFSFTLPSTAWALEGFGPWSVAVVRCALAAVLAGCCLAAVRAPLPDRVHWRGIAVVSLGCVAAFPVLSTLALQVSSTSHAAVVIGLLPITTAVFAMRRGSVRPSRRFWVAAVCGAAAVVAFALVRSGGTPGLADLYLLGALVLCAAGYAEGGRLAAHLPGWQVIAWALVAAAPVTVPAALWALAAEPVDAVPRALVGMAYLGAVSQFGAFVVWYRGMGAMGVARASQLQLAQPLLTLVWAFLLVGESLSPAAPATAVVVLVCIAVTQRSRG